MVKSVDISNTELELTNVTGYDKSVIKINNEIIEYGGISRLDKKLISLSRRVVATSGTIVRLFALSNSGVNTYSRDFISSIKGILSENYFIDNIFQYNNQSDNNKNINSNDKWTFEGDDFNSGLYEGGQFGENITSFEGIKSNNNFNRIFKV